MTKRRSLTTAQRVRIFRDHDGICHLCGGKITAGEAWDVSHDRPLEMLGADDESNWKPAHRVCHRKHTAKVDIPQIAKAKRREARHLGIRAPSKFQTARSGRLKARIGGGVIDRATGRTV